MPKNKASSLTTPDLVLLSLLAERPMHGYQANAELERRQWRDWVGVSRPQVYYSIEKLARAGMIAAAEGDEPSGGPDRRVFGTSSKGVLRWRPHSKAKTGPRSATGRLFLLGWRFRGKRGRELLLGSWNGGGNFCELS
jgi:DNA-binding PadR family transcriptional regulator